VSGTTANYKPYPAYRPSGTEWVGAIPEHWGAKRLKFTHCLRNTKVDCGEPSSFRVALENLEGGTGRYFETDSDFAGEGVSFEIGDILFGKLRPYLAKVWLADREGEALGDFYVLGPEAGVLPRFSFYTLLSQGFISVVDSSTYGTKMPRANWDFVGNMVPPIPPIPEQRAIADFLDRETGRIDALIEKKRRLIELLEEKRSALISHAVTKGLDPDAPMKDSGIDWLGQIPAHWEVKKISLLASLLQTGPFGSQLHADEYIEDGVPVINPSHMINGTIVPDGKCTVDRETADRLGRHRLRTDDIIFARRGEMGRCAIVTDESEGWLCGTGSLLFRPKTALGYSPYLLRVLMGEGVAEDLILKSVGSTMDNLNTEILGATRIPLPPRREQERIVARLTLGSARIVGLVAKNREAIDKLQEYRTALISAAVTGKIDVREEAICG
jgi:type I restriction enzyme, S subunit